MALHFPVIYLLASHMDPDELYSIEEQIPTLTYDVREADVVIGKVGKRERALFELRRIGLKTSEVPLGNLEANEPPTKRRRLPEHDATQDPEAKMGDTTAPTTVGSLIKVAKLAWFTDSIAKGEVLPIDDYVVYQGINLGREEPFPPINQIAASFKEGAAAKQAGTGSAHSMPSFKRRRGQPQSYVPHLMPESTSEHDAAENLPPIPSFLHSVYSCQRPTPANPPNSAFIEQLKEIRTTRLLNGDSIGVRAYSTAIASLAAYPYGLTTHIEVQRLPGCNEKIAFLYQEWKHTGKIKEVEEATQDPRLKILREFHATWGVGDTTAREWYNKGWRDLDDVVEYGWESLTRVQQIGVKYYDELQLKISREEVEKIANIILQHANKIRSGFQMVIVGGYRRGKDESGDVDLILSHPDESATDRFVTMLVDSLSDSDYVTHTLSYTVKNSERGQKPVAWKGSAPKPHGSGFDTLDKALVVWQEPKPGAKKNPNPHRQVDIIISPWKTAGCAVLGWTSGTTFQRDMRKYCKEKLNLKFDSSGIRSRADGRWVDLESRDGVPAPDMHTAERRVFEGLKLEWRPPTERNTG
ncbi:hypothetical protein MCOR02_004384 [Pyricularia oryzae]|nr:hypothetical protein MCOR02_004384 [Pyricularia oryzae]KAI6290013.1 hypothetical protein MCOR34_010548 [Pyricularia oryzae]KAI6473346.1 hypothetical protein MCOR17_002644 [Pyricularia oryzae]KAI6506018.1 hypothetical protein MCOR13_003689 [Pyricularia oryzae]KAI6563214.1 hypothetical protein MCOR04_009205 [Pyricularia oryzae]